MINICIKTCEYGTHVISFILKISYEKDYTRKISKTVLNLAFNPSTRALILDTDHATLILIFIFYPYELSPLSLTQS